jgi:hypothetical protein
MPWLPPKTFRVIDKEEQTRAERLTTAPPISPICAAIVLNKKDRNDLTGSRIHGRNALTHRSQVWIIGEQVKEKGASMGSATHYPFFRQSAGIT